MKRNDIRMGILFTMNGILPMTMAVLSVIGYELIVRQGMIIQLLWSVVFSVISVRLLMDKEWKENKKHFVLFMLMVLLSFCTLLLNMWLSESIGLTVMAALPVVMSMFLWISCAKSKASKVICVVIAVTLSLLVTVVSVVFFTVGQIGYRKTVNTYVSPEGTHRAEVIDCNQGALGGDTVVEVYDERCGLNLYLFEISKAPEMVYLGEWGEFKNMEVYWESEQVLIINILKHVVR